MSTENVSLACHLQSAIQWYESQIEERMRKGEPYEDLQERVYSAKIQVNVLLSGL